MPTSIVSDNQPTATPINSSGLQNTHQNSATLAKSFVAAAMSDSASNDAALAVRLLNDADQVNASDIHIDPNGSHVLIRFRVLGKIHDAAHVDAATGQQLINQIKVLAKLDPVMSALPAESRFTVELDNALVDVRVTALNCHGGEKLHARLLPTDAGGLSLESLGMSPDQLSVLEGWLSEQSGMLLVTGSTGVGKTTTLHAVAKRLVANDLNIITIEDPVEYQLDRATQISVDDDAGLGFPEGLRAAMRLDPDCLLVGELRDPTSVSTAIAASASGHVVLSALHSRNAVEAITVLRRWGAKHGPLASQVSLVINQRLFSRLCSDCRFERLPSDDEKNWFRSNQLEAPEQVFDAAGCAECGQSEVRGRTGVFELWKLTDEHRFQIARGDNVDEIANNLRESGHQFMPSVLMEKIQAGEIRLRDAMA